MTLVPSFAKEGTVESVGGARLAVFPFDRTAYTKIVRKACALMANEGVRCAPARGLDLLPILEGRFSKGPREFVMDPCVECASVVAGPDIPLTPGRYFAVLELSRMGAAPVGELRAQVVDGSQIVAQASVDVDGGNGAGTHRISLPFDVAAAGGHYSVAFDTTRLRGMIRLDAAHLRAD